MPPTPPGFVPLGIVVLRERLRSDAIEVVQFLRDEGVDLKVMSGDAPATVEAVARAVGFENTTTMAGPDVPTDPEGLAEAAERTAVFARVTPEQKQALVQALTDSGRYVAMVGDGVNDVPAMKAARISIALGSGSQIAKGISDIVLISGDYRSIPRGIAEGRRILSNIRRVAKLFVVKSAFAATLILTVGLAGSAYPLLPRHLSLAALFTVGIPSFALALAPSRGRPPSLDFVKDLLRFSVPGGVVSALAVLAAYGATKSLPDRTLEDARTVAVIVLVLTGLYLILLLEDEAIEESSQRAMGVAVLMVSLLAGFIACFSLPGTREFFELSVPGPIEVLLALLATCFAIGALGLLGFRAPLVARRLFGDKGPKPIIPLGGDGRGRARDVASAAPGCAGGCAAHRGVRDGGGGWASGRRPAACRWPPARPRRWTRRARRRRRRPPCARWAAASGRSAAAAAPRWPAACASPAWRRS